MTIAPDQIVLPSGVRIEYAVSGDPDGMPMILLHGWSDSWRSFERVMPHLPPSIRAYSLSMRGHGGSSRPATGYDVRTLTADVAAFMTAVDIPSAAIVGHAMGAIVGARFAIEYPDRTDSLVLMGSKPSFATDPVLADLYATVAAMKDPIDPACVRAFQESVVVRPIDAAVIDTAVAESLKVPLRVWRAVMYGTLQTDFSSELGSIVAPTLLIAGEYDEQGTPSAQRQLLAAIPKARLIEYAGAGHAMHWESPSRVAHDVALFAQNAQPAREAAYAVAS
jgi:pimeloyl-ACP methyl ester carboxylesterase